MKEVLAGPEDYKQLAKRCVELASECSAPTVAEALRALALDYRQSDATLLSRGDEDDRASEGEPLASAPALRERHHRSLARRLIAVRGALDCGCRVSARPHPGTVWRCGRFLANAPDHGAALQHVVVVVVPLPGRSDVEARLRIS
jgi:hypothetical protein